MKKKVRASSRMDVLIDEYLNAALAFGAARRAQDFVSTNEPATKLFSLGKVLRADETGQKLLSRLLNHEDPYVRAWAAKDALSFQPETAVPVLEELRQVSGLLGTSAEYTLREWRAGRLFKDS